MEVGLIFEDDPNQFVWLSLEDNNSTDWNIQTFDLESYVDRTIATIGLRFSFATGSAYEVHIGELALTNEIPNTQQVPTGFTVDEAYFEDNTVELLLSWDFNETNVWFYDIYRIKSNGGKESVGRIYDEVYYVKSFTRLNNETTSTLQLVAVDFNGINGSPVTTTINWPE